ncbi:MAG: C-terminal binding protein [Eubacteriales bacterium]|nr:C-terminal binding protein [Eubacteriales bacterium]
MFKFVTLDPWQLPGSRFEIEKEMLEKEGFEVVLADCHTDDDVVAVAKDADAIALIYHQMTAELMDRLPKCKLLVRYGIGTDTIDIEAASERGIVVCNVPDYCQPDVATHTIALLLDICRKVTYLDRDVRKGNWDSTIGYKVNRVKNLVIGMYGFGSIARTTVQLLSGFEPTIIAYDPYAPDSLFEEFGVKRVTEDELWAQSDVISVHTPLTPETKFAINKESIAKMKEGVIIVNTARGPIIKLDDLLEGLKSGKVKAAGLDVVEVEPIKDPNAEIYKYDTLIVNPHSAYNSVEAEYELHSKVGQSAIDVLVKKIIPYNAVNKKVVTKVKE